MQRSINLNYVTFWGITKGTGSRKHFTGNTLLYNDPNECDGNCYRQGMVDAALRSAQKIKMSGSTSAAAAVRSNKVTALRRITLRAALAAAESGSVLGWMAVCQRQLSHNC